MRREKRTEIRRKKRERSRNKEKIKETASGAEREEKVDE